MKIAVINGSHRSGDTASLAVAMMFDKMISNEGHEPLIIHLNDFDINFPRWDSDMWDVQSELCLRWRADYGQTLASCDAIVLVVPEWNGDAPSSVKDFLDYATCDKVLKLKPVMLVGVSDSAGGVAPVNTLRATGQKNNMFIASPMHVYMRHIETGAGWVVEDMDDAQYAACVNALHMLYELGTVLTPLRKDGALMDMRSQT